MKSIHWKSAVAILTLAAGTMFSPAAGTPDLKVGDPAPKLTQGKYVQGEPVKELEPGKAYIVEFWATWCGPCRESIPHLNETWQKYKDKGLIVIGQNCWEHDDSLVEPFVKKMGDKMTYRVALDDKSGGDNGKMAANWMAAAGQDGIPTAFLIDKTGKIASIGHPMELKDSVIEAVLGGNYDTKKAAADYAEEKKNEGQLETLGGELQKAMSDKKWDDAMAKAGEIEKLLPAGERDSLDLLRFNILTSKKDYPAAYKLGASASEAHKDNAEFQTQLAWMIASDKDIEQRDLKLAQTIVGRADAAAKGKDAGVYHVQARVLFMQGKKDEAVQAEDKAVKLAEGDQQKEEFQKTADSYKKGELPTVEPE
jgi:thiol-disulfide isomerase/thioredoxin